MTAKNQIDELLCTGSHEFFGEFALYFALMQLAQAKYQVIWLEPQKAADYLYPHALVNLGINLHKVNFVAYQNQHQALWVIEEALRSGAVQYIIANGLKQPNLLQSKRLNMAAQKGKSKAFILLNGISQNANSAMTRWQIDLADGQANKYNIKLLRSREKGFISGKENWIMDIKNEKFYINLAPAFTAQQARA